MAGAVAYAFARMQQLFIFTGHDIGSYGKTGTTAL
jgi:hypothetical protein